MTDESEEKRPKLRLSRDVKPEEDAPPESKAPEESATEQTKPKPSIPKPEASTPPEPEATKTRQKLTVAKPNLPKEDTENLPSSPPPITAPKPADTTPQSASTAAPVVAKATPAPTTPSTLDQDLERLEPEKEDSSTLVSIIIIIVLFVILAAAAGGIIWWILGMSSGESQPEEPVANHETSAAQEAPEPTPSITNAVQRAKAVIATVPTSEIPEVTSATDTFEIAPEAAPKIAQPIQKSLPPAQTQTSPKTVAPTNARQQAVTDYLAGIHIDGVRSSSNPKVMIDGQSYLIGDEINEETGLSFSGIQDGRLLFKDRSGIYYLKSF